MILYIIIKRFSKENCWWIDKVLDFSFKFKWKMQRLCVYRSRITTIATQQVLTNPRGPILGARAAVAPTSPPVHRRYTKITREIFSEDLRIKSNFTHNYHLTDADSSWIELRRHCYVKILYDCKLMAVWMSFFNPTNFYQLFVAQPTDDERKTERVHIREISASGARTDFWEFSLLKWFLFKNRIKIEYKL